MNFWGTDREQLKENEVAVSPQQFQEIARIAEMENAEVISHGDAAEKMLAVCPKLQKYRTNKLVVEYDNTRGCFL